MGLKTYHGSENATAKHGRKLFLTDGPIGLILETDVATLASNTGGF